MLFSSCAVALQKNAWLEKKRVDLEKIAALSPGAAALLNTVKRNKILEAKSLTLRAKAAANAAIAAETAGSSIEGGSVGISGAVNNDEKNTKLLALAREAIANHTLWYGTNGVQRKPKLSSRKYSVIRKNLLVAGLEKWPQEEEDAQWSKMNYDRNADTTIDAKYRNRTHIRATFKTHKRHRGKAERYAMIIANLTKMPELIAKAKADKLALRLKKKEKKNPWAL
jgi:hypothetical protein